MHTRHSIPQMATPMTDPTSPHSTSVSYRPPLTWLLVLHALWPPTLMGLAVWWLSDVSYLFAHTLGELMSIVIGITALVVASTSRLFTRNHFVVYVAVALGWCAGLDLLHTLVFKGMQVLPIDSANPATQFWLAARSMQAVALVTAPWFLQRTVRVGWLHLGFGSWSVLCTYLVFSGHFPTAYIDGTGLTPFKVMTEYAIIAALGVAMLLFWRHRAHMPHRLWLGVSTAAFTMMVSEFAFTQYVSVYAHANVTGHILKIYAYWFIYATLVQFTLREPFGMLARAASTYDAVPDPTVIVDREGTILQANQAAARHLGQPAAQLVGQASHRLFHHPALPVAQCPVCAQLQRPSGGTLYELDLPQGRAVECSLAPFAQEDHRKAWVQVVRDITERRHLAQEREVLVHDLGERIKELRCIREVSNLIQRQDLSPSQLLTHTAALLPTGFLYPERAQAAIGSAWGHFGAPLPGATTMQLQVPVLREGVAVATLHVWYDTSSTAPKADFLPEETTLLDNVASLLGKSLERMLATELHQRMNKLYELLSATNRAIVHCATEEELLQALFNALCEHSDFSMFYIARTAQGQWPLHLWQQHGIPTDRLPLMDALLTAPDSPLADNLQLFSQGQASVHTLPQTFTPDSSSAIRPWYEYLRLLGVQQRAVLPLLQDNRLLGVVSLYSTGQPGFDERQMRLLQEMTADLRFALNNFSNTERRQAAEEQARRMEERFTEVFRFAPVPMQIRALDDMRLLAQNTAHQDWLGYERADITDVDMWFERAYPNTAERDTLRQHWLQTIELARQGQTIHSPELTLTGKDGRPHQALGTMAVIGNDIVIAWTDLTDIHRSEQALRESEQRFRGMVEQTISGMYVRRDGTYIYVNPRYCDMLGYSAEELLGHNVLEFTAQDPDNLARIQTAWDQLHSGQHNSVSYTVPLRRRDGSLIQVGLHAKVITWDDGQPATIVMAQDITERQRAEQQIATYVKQLEGSMRGTLQAVSNMVELRDPYTAGHERRVGLIASAIAQELGWSAERCELLELTGLVHDIGKIAVPAEILTKPTRLSPVEMTLVQGHAQAGYDILKDVPFPAPVAEIIRQHHERMDGSGYPQGLKGDAILPEARILAVADVMESMASHRPYRPAVGLDAALAEVVSGRGRFYDPEVVDAMIRLVREKDYMLPK